MQVGNLVVTPISDGTFIARPASFGDDATADGHGDLFDRHGQAWLPIGGFLVRSGDRCVLVDPGLAIRTRDRLWRELEATTSPAQEPTFRSSGSDVCSAAAASAGGRDLGRPRR